MTCSGGLTEARPRAVADAVTERKEDANGTGLGLHVSFDGHAP
jgi:hypothetical protein